MDALLVDASPIAEADWTTLPRLSVCLAIRSLRRSLPLISASDRAAIGDLPERLISLAHAFASGSHLAPGDAMGTARGVAEELGRSADAVSGHDAEQPASAALLQAISALAAGMAHAAESIALMEYKPFDLGWRDELVRTAAHSREARSHADAALSGALRSPPLMDEPGRSEGVEADRSRIETALAADNRAVERHKRREVERLGNPTIDLTAFDPAIDASEGGPLGLLWPQGAPSWHHDDIEAELPVVVSFERFRADHEAAATAEIVVHGLAYGVASWTPTSLREGGLEFVRFVTSSHDARLQPVPCVYLPDRLPDAIWNQVMAALVGAGGIVYRDRDFFPADGPTSDEELVRAMVALHRGMEDRWRQS